MSPKYEGISVTLGGTEYIVPPLSLRSVRKFALAIQQLGDDSALAGPEKLDRLLEVVHASLVRNYPDITIEELGEMLDLGNMMAVFEAVMRASGFTREPAAAPGEAPAAG